MPAKQHTDGQSAASTCSRSSVTPETDEFKKMWPDSRRHNWPCTFEADAFAKIEKLERERDEARREAIRWQDAWMNETTLHEMGSTLMPWLRDWKKSAENAERIRGDADA